MKNSTLLRIGVLVVSMVIIIGNCLSMPAFATINSQNLDNNTEEKVLCNFAIEDDFADDSILVVYKNEVSLLCNPITLDMFSTINAQSIENLSLPIEERVKTAKSKILEASTKLSIGERTETIEIDVDLKNSTKLLRSIC